METIYIETTELPRLLDSGGDALFFESGVFMKVKVIEIVQISNEIVGISLEVCSSFFGSIFNMPKVEYFSYEEDQRREFKVSGSLKRHALDRKRLALHHLNMHLIFEEEILSKFETKALKLEDIISSVFF
jgi:hypothetical protein